jgi:hypothetical protein
MELGYALSSEEHAPLDLVRHARRATAEVVVCGPDPDRHLEALEGYVDAGFDHVYVHQVGSDQERFFDFYEREVAAAAEELQPRVVEGVRA